MARARIGLQLEKSTTAGSIVKTSAINEQEYLSPGSNGQVLTVVAGVPAWGTIPFPSEFEQVANNAARPVTGSLDVIYYATAENVFSIWTGTVYVTVPSSPSFTLAGNSGTSQSIASGSTLSVLASLGFATVASATGIVTLTPPAGVTTGNVMTWNGTIWTSTAPASSSFTLAGDTGTSQTVTGGSTATIKGGVTSGVLVTMSATNTATITLKKQRDVFAPVSAATTVTLTQTPNLSTLEIFRNGFLQDLTTDYTVAGLVVTFVVAFNASSGATNTESVSAIYNF